MKVESKFRLELSKEIKSIFKGAIVILLDPKEFQGYPDILILYNDMWAALETKRTINASRRPNQDYYINLMNKMSFARFVYPENKEDVLNELQQAFGIKWSSRLSRS